MTLFFILSISLYKLIESDYYCIDLNPLVIIGSGLAGHAAAAEALNKQKEYNIKREIIVIEKESKYGGNSMKATSGINGAKTQMQVSQKIKDDVGKFAVDIMNSAYNDNLKEPKINDLVSTLAKNSANAVNWLTDKFDLKLNSITQCGGHSIPRTHRFQAGPVGNIIVKTIHNYLEKEGVQFWYNSTVTDIVVDRESDRILGVEWVNESDSKKESNELFASSVIFATGGFGNDHNKNTSLLNRFSKNDENKLPTTNGIWATGDGVKIAEKHGIKLVDMSEIQVHPTGFINPKEPNAMTKFLCPEAIRGLGGILINSKGKRFVNELDLRKKVVEKMNNEKDNKPFRVLLNKKVVEAFGKNIGFYIKFGLIKKYNNVNELSKDSNIDVNTLTETLTIYKNIQNSDEFGKKIFPNKDHFDPNSEIYAGLITPVIHYTMGGIKINKEAQVIDKDNKIIDGFYAAGEVTGGVHGKNRLAGNSLLECVVYGRIAGRNAVEFCRDSKTEL